MSEGEFYVTRETWEHRAGAGSWHTCCLGKQWCFKGGVWSWPVLPTPGPTRTAHPWVTSTVAKPPDWIVGTAAVRSGRELRDCTALSLLSYYGIDWDPQAGGDLPTVTSRRSGVNRLGLRLELRWPELEDQFCLVFSGERLDFMVPPVHRLLLLVSRCVMSDSLRPHGLQHARLLCLPVSSRVCSDSCPLSQWRHPTISSSVTPFFSCPQSFPASGSFPAS